MNVQVLIYKIDFNKDLISKNELMVFSSIFYSSIYFSNYIQLTIFSSKFYFYHFNNSNLPQTHHFHLSNYQHQFYKDYFIFIYYSNYYLYDEQMVFILLNTIHIH